MSISFNQQNSGSTTAPFGTGLYCNSWFGGAVGASPYNELMDQTALGTANFSVIHNPTGAGVDYFFYFWSAIDNANLDENHKLISGNCVVNLNVATVPATPDILWQTTHVCHVNASGTNIRSIGFSHSGQVLNATGVYTMTFTGSPHSGSPYARGKDYVLVMLGFRNTAAVARRYAYKPDQIIILPFKKWPAERPMRRWIGRGIGRGISS